jgi:hypothetical protein
MGLELTDTIGDTVPSPRMTRQSEEVILNIMTDVQKAVDQLGDMSNSEDARKFTFPVYATTRPNHETATKLAWTLMGTGTTGTKPPETWPTVTCPCDPPPRR